MYITIYTGACFQKTIIWWKNVCCIITDTTNCIYLTKHYILYYTILYYKIILNYYISKNNIDEMTKLDKK